MTTYGKQKGKTTKSVARADGRTGTDKHGPLVKFNILAMATLLLLSCFLMIFVAYLHMT